MRAMIAGLSLALAFLGGALRVDAQDESPSATAGVPFHGGGSVTTPMTAAGVRGGLVGLPHSAGGMVAGGAPGSMTPPSILPYSYYASPGPARVYVGYGPLDPFPFHGRPYGSPGDRWSWYTMGGGAGRYLARYYFPPLR